MFIFRESTYHAHLMRLLQILPIECFRVDVRYDLFDLLFLLFSDKNLILIIFLAVINGVSMTFRRRTSIVVMLWGINQRARVHQSRGCWALNVDHTFLFLTVRSLHVNHESLLLRINTAFLRVYGLLLLLDMNTSAFLQLFQYRYRVLLVLLYLRLFLCCPLVVGYPLDLIRLDVHLLLKRGLLCEPLFGNLNVIGSIPLLIHISVRRSDLGMINLLFLSYHLRLLSRMEAITTTIAIEV